MSPLFSTLGASSSRTYGLRMAAGRVPYDIEYLVVGGGGSAGAQDNNQGAPGGGGAGGYLAGTLSSVALDTVISTTVGAGGTGVSPPNGSLGVGNYTRQGNNGGNSVLSGSGLSTLTAYGGGGGGGKNADGLGGGSGGGASGFFAGGSGTSGQGFAGGGSQDYISSGNYGAGGGGASQNGINQSSGSYGGGGLGLDNDIIQSGVNVTYATGGDGGQNAAGLNPSDRPANTGYGSHGRSSGSSSPNAGSGIIVLRMLTKDYSGTSTGSPTVTTDGLYTVIQFLSVGSGSYTV